MIDRLLIEADWPNFVLFAKKHFGQFLHFDRKFNQHWFYANQSDKWSVRIIEDPQRGIVGVMQVILVPVKFGSQSTQLAWISNAAVEEDFLHQGSGAFLYLWVYKTFPLVGAMSGNELSGPINNSMAMDIPQVKMRRFIYIHNNRTINLCLPHERKAVKSAYFSLSDKSCRGLVYNWTDLIPDDYDRLWSDFRKKIYCTTERNRQYLNWRYLKAPYTDYRILEMRFDGQLHALAVLKLQPTPEGNACRVLDFFADNDWASEAWVLLAKAVEKEEALFTDFMVIGTVQDEALLKAGYLIADEANGLDAIPHLLSPVEHRKWSNTFHLGGKLAKQDQAWRKQEAVYFTKGDADRDWPTLYDLSLRNN